jgi:hypothetical protein
MAIQTSKILGYGEDAFTLWGLKRHTSKILNRFQDKTAPSKCLTFYRPSFGRRSRKGNSVFGEFDAIIVSPRNIYLIESKWDNLAENRKNEIKLGKEQRLRHEIFSWYLTHWNKKYSGHWERFRENHKGKFKFQTKTIPLKGSLLATNLEFILAMALKHCKAISPKNVKNVLLFFHDGKRPKKLSKISKTFKVVTIDYGKKTKGNFINLSD